MAYKIGIRVVIAVTLGAIVYLRHFDATIYYADSIRNATDWINQ